MLMAKQKEKKEADNKKHSGLIDSTIGAATTENVGQFGEAAGEYVKGYEGAVDATGKVLRKGLKQVAESKVHPDYTYQNIKQQAGFSAEIHYVNKENAESIINDNSRRIARSNDLGRGNDTKYDVLSVDEQGNSTWGAQMKFCGKFGSAVEIKASARHVVDKLASDKWERYRGNKVLIPSEQYDAACTYSRDTAAKYLKQAARFRQQGDTAKAAMLEQRAQVYQQVSKDLQDSGISSEEAIFLREHPQLATAKYVVQTAHQSGLDNARSAAVLSGSIALAQNIVSVARGEKDFHEACRDVGLDVAAGAATGYLIGAGDTAVRGVMSASSNSIFINLSKSSLPAMVATTTVQVGKSLIRYAKGEINSLELVEELGEKGTGMMAASFGAAIGTAVFPGIGTVIGGMMGYMTSSTIYQACMTVLREERLSTERRGRIHCIAEAAMEAMEKEGAELLALIDAFYDKRRVVFANALSVLSIAAANDDVEAFTQGLSCIAVEMGKTLQFKCFNDFDQFMSDDQSSFIF